MGAHISARNLCARRIQSLRVATFGRWFSDAVGNPCDVHWLLLVSVSGEARLAIEVPRSHDLAAHHKPSPQAKVIAPWPGQLLVFFGSRFAHLLEAGSTHEGATSSRDSQLAGRRLQTKPVVQEDGWWGYASIEV